MCKRLLSAILTLGCLPLLPAPAIAITVQLFPLTGEIRLLNQSTQPVPFVFYSIISPSGALTSSPAVWRSIADNYDASGNQVVDPINNWVKLSPVGSTTELSEGVFADPGGSLPPLRAISLGRVWNPNKVAFPDLVVELRQANQQLVPAFFTYTVDGDYSGNGSADFFDYEFHWRPAFGSTTNLLSDGNLNGVVDAADYVVWRDNLFKTAPLPPYPVGSGSLAAAASVVPEPASQVVLLLLAGVSAWTARRRRS